MEELCEAYSKEIAKEEVEPSPDNGGGSPFYFI